MTGVLLSDSQAVSRTAFFVRVKLASFLLWLAGCQVPKPQPSHSPPTQTPTPNPSHPEKSWNIQRKFPGPIRPRACPHPSSDPHHYPNPSYHPPSLWPLLPPLPWIQRDREQLEGEVQLVGSGLKVQPDTSRAPSNSSCLKSPWKRHLLHLNPEVLKSAAEYTYLPDISGGETGREMWRTTLFDKSIVLLWLTVFLSVSTFQAGASDKAINMHK